tara:strand:- start:336 stop:566 length:231 start_codon:yes stop_codon:yes gene_type:complete
MKTIKTKIENYEVELEIDLNEDPSTDCFVSRGNYSASLACLSQTGKLWSHSNIDEEKEVLDRVIHKIEDWAEANGY